MPRARNNQFLDIISFNFEHHVNNVARCRLIENDGKTFKIKNTRDANKRPKYKFTNNNNDFDIKLTCNARTDKTVNPSEIRAHIPWNGDPHIGRNPDVVVATFPRAGVINNRPGFNHNNTVFVEEQGDDLRDAAVVLPNPHKNIYISIGGGVTLEEGVNIYSGVYDTNVRNMEDVTIKDNVTVNENTIIEHTTFIGKSTIIGKNSHIRSSYIGKSCNFGDNIVINNNITTVLNDDNNLPGTFDVANFVKQVVQDHGKLYKIIICDNVKIITGNYKVIIVSPCIITENTDVKFSVNKDCTIGPYVYIDSPDKQVVITKSSIEGKPNDWKKISNETDEDKEKADKADKEDNKSEEITNPLEGLKKIMEYIPGFEGSNSPSSKKLKYGVNNSNNDGNNNKSLLKEKKREELGTKVMDNLDTVKKNVSSLIEELSRTGSNSYYQKIQNVDDYLSALKIKESAIQDIKVKKDDSLLGEFNWVIKDMKKEVKDKQLFSDSKEIYELLNKDENMIKKYNYKSTIDKNQIINDIQDIINNDNNEEYIQRNKKIFIKNLYDTTNTNVFVKAFTKYYDDNIGTDFSYTNKVEYSKTELYRKYCKLLSITITRVSGFKEIHEKLRILYDKYQCRYSNSKKKDDKKKTKKSDSKKESSKKSSKKSSKSKD